MKDEKYLTIYRLVERVGVPTAILGFFLWGVFALGKPIVSTLVSNLEEQNSAQIKHMATQAQNYHLQTEILSEMSTSIRETKDLVLADKHENKADMIKGLRDLAEQNHSKLENELRTIQRSVEQLSRR